MMNKVSDYVANYLIQIGVTDVFGVPGGVILDFLYSLHARKKHIRPRLCYHEQAAAFAACGYAQISGDLGVAYATRGPGVTNMYTAVADAYCDSLPVLFVTAHAHVNDSKVIRFEQNQEFDTVQAMSPITKYAARVDRVSDVRHQLEYAASEALSGRPGPVWLDFSTSVLKTEIDETWGDPELPDKRNPPPSPNDMATVHYIYEALRNAKRPVLLIGDGVRLSGAQNDIRMFVENTKIPVLSSRFAQDILPDSPYYFGYIGSHGVRCANFILSKCDLIISLGNRLAYNPDSQSFCSIAKQATCIRLDVDEHEFNRTIPNSVNFHAHLNQIAPLLAKRSGCEGEHEPWVKVCHALRSALLNADTDYPVALIAKMLKFAENGGVITSDVGNNEFWLSRAYTYSGIKNRILYSKAFGAMGCSLPKAIGAYYATGKRVFCFSGDQGFQMNLQELQFLAREQLPVTVVILNNSASGMIRAVQQNWFNGHFVHTTRDSGYTAPDFRAIASAYSIPYYVMMREADLSPAFFQSTDGPVFIEVKIDETADVWPILPMGRACQDFEPKIDKTLFDYLDAL
jgi:acetolactate synthase-1/2/3 large subunit